MTDAGLIKVLGTNKVVRYAVLSSDLSDKNLRCRVTVCGCETRFHNGAYKSARKDDLKS